MYLTASGMTTRQLLTALVLLLTIAVTVVSYPLDPIEEESEHPRLSLISFRWHEVKGYVVVSMFLLTAAAVKIGYHHSRGLHTHVPESCVLIVLGTVVGVIIHAVDAKGSIPQFSSELFFFILLPPIILESAYSLHDKTFFNNIRTVLLYAVFGTLMNVFLVGASLYVVEQFGWFGREDIPLVECFTFSTLISAVDPVAVLAIFQELGVNKALYFLVFGESLLNDAVVITLYNMVTTFAVSRVISTYDVVIGTLNFITVSGGGLIIGVLLGAVTALVTRITNDVRVVEPLIVVVLAYFSYVGAELFHFSGIIALIACGLMQAEYVKDNISNRSFTTIKYFTKTLSSIADVAIFYFLGRNLIRDDHVWDTGFVFFSTFFCVVYRFVSVFLLTYIANRYIQRVRMINFEEQLLMAYGGLRGAIAFSLAIMLEENHVKHARIFITTSLFIVLFTVFVLGSTTKPVVRWLEVQLHVHQDTTMFMEINNKVIETVMAGIEEVAGHRSVNYWNEKFQRFNEKYLKNILTHGDGHAFKDTFDVLYNIIPKTRKTTQGDLDIEELEFEDDVFKDPEPKRDATEVGTAKAQKKLSFKMTSIGLARAGSKGRHPSKSSTEENVQNQDRKTLAAAFSRSAFFQLPEKDDVDDDENDRKEHEGGGSKKPSERRKNRWASARSKLEDLATEDIVREEGVAGPSSESLEPLRKVLLSKRASFFAVAEGALSKKRAETASEADATDSELDADVPLLSGDTSGAPSDALQATVDAVVRGAMQEAQDLVEITLTASTPEVQEAQHDEVTKTQREDL